MAYNKVGTPRFYIDYLSYWQSIGMVHSLSKGTHNEAIDGSYVGLDPSKLCNISVESNDNVSGVSNFSIDFNTFIDQGTLENINYGGVIGHNLSKSVDDGTHTLNKGSAAVRFSVNKMEGYDLLQHQQAWRGALAPQLVPSDERNIINSTNYSAENRTFLDDSGFSLFRVALQSQVNSNVGADTLDPETGEYLSETDGGVPWDLSIHGANVDRISFVLNFWDETAAEGAGDWLVDAEGYSGSWAANSIVLGHYYDMPHSPELDLSMTIENDGVDIFTTTGGSHISNIKYNGAPMWKMDDGTSIPPWTIGEPTTSGRRRGRRVWDLKFSYLSDKDLFASNPMRGTYMEDDTNIDFGDKDELNWSANLITNGTFAVEPDPSDDWLLQTGWAWDSDNEYATCSSGNANLQQDVGAVADVEYKITVKIAAHTSGNLDVDIGNSTPFRFQESELSTGAVKETTLTAVDGGSLRFYGGSFRGSLDNIEVRASNPKDFYYNITTDESFQSRVLNYIGNGQRFIFQPDNTSSNPSDFAICQLDQDSLQISQVANGKYNINLKIREVW